MVRKIKRKRGKEFPIVRKTKLNNKSRKGNYIYLKLGKGQRGAYYKQKKGMDLDDYLFAYKAKLRSKKKGVTKVRSPEKYLQKVTKTRTLEGMLGKGYAEIEVNNIHKLTLAGIRRKYKELLLSKIGKNKIVAGDKTILNVLVMPENIQKYKHRIEIVALLKDEKGGNIAKISAFGKKTLQQFRSEITQRIKIGTNIVDASPSIAKDVKNMGYIYSHKNNGRVSRIDVKVIYRKG